jgi:hypothetical protein
VADIKHTGVSSNSMVFIIDAAVADRHIVSCKLSHLRPQVNMLLSERCILHAKNLGAKIAAVWQEWKRMFRFLPTQIKVHASTISFKREECIAEREE